MEASFSASLSFCFSASPRLDVDSAVSRIDRTSRELFREGSLLNNSTILEGNGNSSSSDRRDLVERRDDLLLENNKISLTCSSPSSPSCSDYFFWIDVRVGDHSKNSAQLSNSAHRNHDDESPANNTSGLPAQL